MNFPADIWLPALTVIGSALGVYAAIRADLARLQVQVATAIAAAERAHERIDEFLRRTSP